MSKENSENKYHPFVVVDEHTETDIYLRGVFLNGELVMPETISPKYHKFIGMYRHPSIPATGVYCITCCRGLTTNQESAEHYMDGHFDIPQYVDIHPS